MYKFKVGDKVTWGRGGDLGTITGVEAMLGEYVWVRSDSDPDCLPWVGHVRNLILYTPIIELLYG